jgi:acetoin utilization deacetylase AcuC-like enzyme
VHAGWYVDAVRTGEPLDLAQSQGFAWSPAFADSVARIWSGHVAACRLALARKLSFHPASGAHHAREKQGSGFCTFNYLVGAGKQLAEEGLVERVLVLDLDTHQGNGTFELSASDERFSLFDVGGASFGVNPREKGRHFIRLVKNEKEYFAALEKLPAFLDAHRPSLIQYQAGMDCHESDPLGGVKGMTAERLAERDRMVFELAKARGIPICFNLAGGYQEDGTTVGLHIETVRTAARVFI